jgi:hypothetical protein
MKVRTRLALVAAFVIANVAPCRAGDATATELLRRGIALRREHRNEEALASFEAASQIEPSPCATAQIGLAQQALSRWSEAEVNLTLALAATHDPWIRKHRTAIEGAMATVAMHLGWLEVDATPAEARVIVDGHATLAAGVPTRISTGPRLFVVEAAGYSSFQGEAAIAAGVVTRVTASLRSLERDDGAAKTDTASPDTRQDLVAPVPSSANSQAREASVLAPRPGTVRLGVIPLSFMVLGTVAVGVGLGSGWLAVETTRTRNDHCSSRYCDPTGLAADHDARSWSTMATVEIAAGSCAVLAGVTWALLSRSPHIRVVPTLGTTRGLTMEGEL